MISKSKFMRGVKCIKYLYLDTFHKDLAHVNNQFKFNGSHSGYKVEQAMYKLYFGGINVYDELKSVEQLAADTIDAIESGYQIIYQPTFISQDGTLSFRGDLLVKVNNRYKLIEIKSSTKIKVPTHIFDVGFQYTVLNSHIQSTKSSSNQEKLIYKYKSRRSKFEKYRNIDIYISYINSEYIFDGKLDLAQLFIEENVTSRAKKNMPLVQRILLQYNNAVKRRKKPEVKIGKQCVEPDVCPFHKECWKNIPNNSIQRAFMLSERKIQLLEDRGVTSIEEIPNNFSLTEIARTEVLAELDKKEVIKSGKLRSFIQKLGDGPYLFLDFESINPGIPVFINTRPYQQICFQYSLLVQQSNKEYSFERKEYLAEYGFDPRREFILNLLSDTDRPGNIVVYHQNFEKSRLQELADEFPDLKLEIENRISRIVDLSEPFKERYYYHRDFRGKYSLKVVAPILCPEISYDNLKIQNGTQAMQVFDAIPKLNRNDRYQSRNALLEYCHTDVLCLAHLLKSLQSKI